MLVEAAGASIHVFARSVGRTAEKGGVNQVGGIIADGHEIEIAAVSGGLEGVVGNG